MSRPSTLSRWRTSLGFTLEEVAQRARWAPARQRALEAGAEATAEEAEILSCLLGADFDSVVEGRVAPQPLSARLKGQASELDADSRFSLAEAMGIAVEIQDLRRRLDLPTGLGRVAEFVSNSDYGHPEAGTPERLANVARQKLGLGTGAIGSFARDVLEPLGVIVLWAPLPPRIDAVAFATEETGAVIVANPAGVHMQSAAGRRVTWAHEVCHLLFDRPEMSRFGRACQIEGEPVGLEGEWFERIERRARAFALALLAPRAGVEACWSRSDASPPDRVRAVMIEFGIGYSAARSHLHNHGLLSLKSDVSLAARAEMALWEAADPRPVPPPDSAPWLRAGTLTDLARLAHERGLVSRRWVEERAWGPLAAPRAWRPTPGDGVGFETTSTERARTS